MPGSSDQSRKPAVDPAYMKPSHVATMETRDLGQRLTQEELLRLSQRNLNRSFEMGLLAGVSSVGGTLSRVGEGGSDGRRQRRSKSSLARRGSGSHRQSVVDLMPPALMSASNVEAIARHKEALKGEFGIISRTHIARYEQDSAFKKERVLTPEIMALKNRLGDKSGRKNNEQGRLAKNYRLMTVKSKDTAAPIKALSGTVEVRPSSD